MPRPTRLPRPLASLAAALVVALALVLAGCGASPTTTTTARGPVATSSPTPTDSPAPTPTPSSTAKPAPVLCGNTPLPTPTSGGPVASGPFNGWDGVPVLPGTLLYSDGARASDGVQTSSTAETVGLCTPGVTPSAVTSFYVTKLPANGWATIATAPQGPGLGFQSCSAGACWKRAAGNNTTSYVALDAVRTAGGAALYTLTRLDVTTN